MVLLSKFDSIAAILPERGAIASCSPPLCGARGRRDDVDELLRAVEIFQRAHERHYPIDIRCSEARPYHVPEFVLDVLGLERILGAAAAVEQHFLEGAAVARRDLHPRRVPERRSHALDLRIDVSGRSEEHTSELQSQSNLVCRLLLEKKNQSYLIGSASSMSPA